MKRRNHHPNQTLPQFLQQCLNSIKRLWRSLVKSVRIFFSDDLSKNTDLRDRKSARDSKSNLESEQLIVIPRPAPFLIGLDDLPNLESLTTREFVDLIEWNAESQEILVAKEEDLTLLEDLLVSFPES